MLALYRDDLSSSSRAWWVPAPPRESRPHGDPLLDRTPTSTRPAPHRCRACRPAGGRRLGGGVPRRPGRTCAAGGASHFPCSGVSRRCSGPAGSPRPDGSCAVLAGSGCGCCRLRAAGLSRSSSSTTSRSARASGATSARTRETALSTTTWLVSPPPSAPRPCRRLLAGLHEHRACRTQGDHRPRSGHPRGGGAPGAGFRGTTGGCTARDGRETGP